jgi:ubiquitin conjugation factor E4 B
MPDSPQPMNVDQHPQDPPQDPPQEAQQQDPPELTADEIRRRRLARFNTPATTTTPTTPTTPTTTANTTTSPTPIPTPTATPSPTKPTPVTPTPAPTVKPAAKDASPPKPSIITMPRSAPSNDPDASNKKLKFSSIPLEDWAILENVFQVSFTPSSQNVYLESLIQELEDEYKTSATPLTLTKNFLERIIVDRLSIPNPNLPPSVDYLIGCFKRVVDHIRKSKSKQNRLEILEAAQNLIASYSVLVMLYPEMFRNSKSVQGVGSLQLLHMLKANPGGEQALPIEYLDHIVTRTAPEDLEKIFTPIFHELATRMRDITLIGAFTPPLRVLLQLTKYKPLANVFINLPNWNLPKLNGRQIECSSSLGPFFRLTTLPEEPSVGEQYFSNPTARGMGRIKEGIDNVRILLGTVHKMQFEIVYQLLKFSREHRDAVLSWLATVLDKNIARGRINADYVTTSTDGFLLNLCSVFLELCDPFMDPGYTKVGMIDSSYFVAHSRIDLSKETKLAATSDEVAAWVDKRNPNRWRHQGQSPAPNTTSPTITPQSPTPTPTPENRAPPPASTPKTEGPNFITECFFLTLRTLHLGYLKTVHKLQTLMRQLKEEQNAKREMMTNKTPNMQIHLEKLEQ